jgi:hypothetical protein
MKYRKFFLQHNTRHNAVYVGQISPNEYVRRSGTWSPKELQTTVAHETFNSSVKKFDLAENLDRTAYPDRYTMIYTGVRPQNLKRAYNLD